MKKKLILILSMLSLTVSIMALSIGATSVKLNKEIVFYNGFLNGIPINQEFVQIDGVDSALNFYHQGVKYAGFDVSEYKNFVDDCLQCEPGQANFDLFSKFVVDSYDVYDSDWPHFYSLFAFNDTLCKDYFNYYYYYDDSNDNDSTSIYTEEDLKLEYEKGKIAGQAMASSTDVESDFDYTTLLPSILILCSIALIPVIVKQKRKRK